SLFFSSISKTLKYGRYFTHVCEMSPIAQMGPTDIRSLSNMDKGDILRTSVKLPNLQARCPLGID
ncbi:Uncharacterized protein APZ42_029069, partial [Daphnia magna]